MRASAVSVIIPTRNQAKLLKLCLGSFRKQRVFPKEIILVDNCSTDDTRKIAGQFVGKLPIRYLLEKRVGPSFARNRGIAEANGEILAFLDSDCLPQNDWVENIWKSHQKKKNVVFQGNWVNVPLQKSFALSLYLYCLETHRQLLFSSDVLDTKNFSLPKNLLFKNNLLFDNSLPIYAEDIDFCLRVLQAGIPIVYNPDIKVTHLAQKDFFGFMRTNFQMGKAKSLLEEKWQLKKNRKQKIGRPWGEIWQKKREKHISLTEREVFKKIVADKNYLYLLLFGGSIKMGNALHRLGEIFGTIT